MFHNEGEAGFFGCPASPILEAVRAAQSPLAVVMPLEAGGAVMFSNEAFAAFYERLASELKGQVLSTLTVDEQEAQAIRHALADAGRGRVNTMRLSRITSAGLPVEAFLSLAAVIGADGETFCVMCSLVVTTLEDRPDWIECDAKSLALLAEAASQVLAPEATKGYAAAE